MTISLTIIARELASALSAADQIVDRAAKIPILKCVRLTVADNRLEVVATNTAQTILARASCEGEGATCLDLQSLDAKVKNLRQGEPVTLAGDGKSVTISQGRTRWKLPCLPVEDFPSQVAEPVKGKAVAAPANMIADMKTASAGVDVNEPRVHLNGVYIGKDICGTDGKMVAMMASEHAWPGAIIPLPAVRSASSLDGDISVTVGDRSIQFDTQWLTVKSQLVDGTYPDVRRVVPTDLPGLLTVDRDEFRAAVMRASAIRADGEKASAFVPVVLKIRDAEIEIFASNRDGEEGSDYVACDRATGDDCDIRFSGALMIKAVDSLACDTLELKFRDHMSPVLMSPAGSVRENIRVVMPRTM